MNSTIRKVLSLIIILSIITVSIISFGACSPKSKKAILVLPGVMGSIYYKIDEDTGEKVAIWSGESPDEFLSSFRNMDLLVCDDEGIPMHDNVYVADWNDKELWKYGSNLKMIAGPDQLPNEGDVIRTMTQGLEDEFGDRYDVRVYQFDWRLDLRYLGEQLENFINQEGYTEVILVTHSMGGMVASNYLARSQANCDKVSLFVPIACPFLGSVEIYSYMETGAFPGYDDIGIDLKKLTGFGNTIQSAYQLFPFPALYDSYPEGVSPVSVNGVGLSYDEASILLKQRAWAQKKNSSGVRPQFDTIPDAINGLYDAEGKHITTKVNTYFIATNSYKTRYNINYSSADINGVYDNLNVDDSINKTVSGDSIVPIYSALLGQIDNMGNPTADNILIISTNTSSHMYVAATPEAKAKVLELVRAMN